MSEQQLACVALWLATLVEVVDGRLHDRRRNGVGSALMVGMNEHARTRVDQLHAAVVLTPSRPARSIAS